MKQRTLQYKQLKPCNYIKVAGTIPVEKICHFSYINYNALYKQTIIHRNQIINLIKVLYTKVVVSTLLGIQAKSHALIQTTTLMHVQ